jgi:hypothetical protein
VTPIERILNDARIAWLQRNWYESEAWAAKASEEIRAMAESRRRSISQKFRFLAARLAAKHGRKA